MRAVGPPQPDDDEQPIGCFWQTRLPDGQTVQGAARDAAQAAEMIRSLQEQSGEACGNCLRVIVRDAAGRWTHKYADGFGDDADRKQCHPPKLTPVAEPGERVNPVRPYVQIARPMTSSGP